MNLQDLHQRTGIRIRKLRYCLDHSLIPGLDVDLTPGEAGRPRQFSNDAGFAIICAASLLSLRIRHETIRSFLRGLTEIPIHGKGRKKSLLVSILEGRLRAHGQLSDDGKVRIIVEEPEYDSKWLTPGKPSKPVENYEPRASVTLNLGKIRDQVFSDL